MNGKQAKKLRREARQAFEKHNVRAVANVGAGQLVGAGLDAWAASHGLRIGKPRTISIGKRCIVIHKAVK